MSSEASAELAQLKQLLKERSVRFGEFTLVSGAKSDVYVDCKLTTYRPEAIPLIGRAFLRKFRERGWLPQAVGGLSLGADPISFAIARESLDHGAEPISAFIVRKEAKKHGTQKFIEGLESTQGVPVVVIDDVATTGRSTAQALERIQQAGMKVLAAVCLVDREMGARELLEKQHGVPFDSILKLSDLREKAAVS